MRSGDVQVRSSMLAEVVGEFERGGAGRPEDIARRLGPEWTEERVRAALAERVRAALAELFSGGVVGHNPEVGVCWVA